MTWEDVAEGHEMAAKAMMMRARAVAIPANYMRACLRDALVSDANDAVMGAAHARACQRDGWILTPSLAEFVSFAGTV